MSIGHSQGEAPHTPDMRKKAGDVTQEEKREAQRRIEGSMGPDPSDARTAKPSLAARIN